MVYGRHLEFKKWPSLIFQDISMKFNMAAGNDIPTTG